MLFIIITGVFLFVILGNVMSTQLIKRRTINHFVRPFFESRGYKIIETKFAGFFNTDDFEKQKYGISLISEMGKMQNSVYFLVYTSKTGLKLKYTVRVKTIFLFIKKVELKGNEFDTILDIKANY